MKLNPFLFLCATGLLAIFSSTISKSPALPLFARHLGADPSGIGFIAGISAFAGVAFSVPAGMMADRFGKKQMILVATTIFATAPFGYLVVNTLWQLALVRFFHGFATAIFIPVAMALVSGLSQKERGEKLGWFSTATLLGRFMAPIVGGGILGLYSLESSTGYTLVYLVCSGVGIATLAMASSLSVPQEPKQISQSWLEMFYVFKTVALHRNILLTCFVEAAILFAYGTFETFLPLYAVNNGLTTTQIGIFLSGQIIVLALTKPIMGKFSDRHGRRPQIFAGGVLGAASIGGFYFVSSFLPLFCLSITFGLCLSVVTSATSAYIADLSSSEAHGSAMGLLGSIMDIGHTTGPLLSGIVAASFGYAHSFLGAALVLLCVSLLFHFMIGQRPEGCAS
ncbi:MAG: MFS transporter [Proteobacteria bacterium]|nr:MFS transporter [Desulfobulbaceae bacterium]MBU4151812.1 MFS transporter [Pseudomonadota bacterium]MDP2106240.1 MFS transporter [Desulfobulbaceae bacterium]